MFGRKTLARLEHMLDAAIEGDFRESDYDESELSKIEAKWKHFLGASVLSRENLEKEKENVKGLVSDISHQTKTPMANIKLYAALLKENMEASGAAENMEASGAAENMEGAAGQAIRNQTGSQNEKLLGEIIRQTEKLEFLIESLTKMSRLESNIVEVKPTLQSISGLLKECVAEAGAKAQQKGIELRNTYQGDGEAYFDRKWTKEALGNVLDNAVKYSHPGSEIIISVTEYELYMAIAVKDYGIGMKEEDTAKIFGRFYRAEEVQQEDGVGLGLYLAREILRKENGYIKVKSRQGKGSEFILHLQRDRFS